MTMKNLKTESLKQFHDGTTYKLWRTCACGCEEVVQNVWAPGHDMRKAPVAKPTKKGK